MSEVRRSLEHDPNKSIELWSRPSAGCDEGIRIWHRGRVAAGRGLREEVDIESGFFAVIRLDTLNPK